MPQIANNYKDFSNLNKLKNDTNINNNLNSLSENLQTLPKEFLFPNINRFNHKTQFAHNTLMQPSFLNETIYEKFEKRELKALIEKEIIETGDVLIKTREKTEEKKPQIAKTLLEEETTESKKETPVNTQKEQASFASKSFIFKALTETPKEEEKKKETLTKDETFNAEMNLNPKEDEKFKMELKKQETQGEKHNLEQPADAKGAERQVIELLNSQKFSKEESKKAQEKSKKETTDLLEKEGKERKRVNRKQKGGLNNGMKNTAEDNKTTFTNFISNLICTKKPNLLFFLLFAIISLLVVYNIF